MLLSTRMFVVCLLALMLSASTVFAQQNNEPKNENNRDILLQLLVSTNAAAQENDFPATVALLEKKLKNDFGNAKYKLVLTLLNRAADNGFLKVKGISPFEQTQSSEKSLNFYEANLTGIRSTDKNEVQIENLSFGLRVPIVINSGATADGKNLQVTNYEHLGITAGSLNVPFNDPTIIGTMTTPRPNENIILVLTVKPSSGVSLTAKKQ